MEYSEELQLVAVKPNDIVFGSDFVIEFHTQFFTKFVQLEYGKSTILMGNDPYVRSFTPINFLI